MKGKKWSQAYLTKGVCREILKLDGAEPISQKEYAETIL